MLLLYIMYTFCVYSGVLRQGLTKVFYLLVNSQLKCLQIQNATVNPPTRWALYFTQVHQEAQGLQNQFTGNGVL